MLQTPQVIILHLELPIKDHQFRHHADKLVLLLRRLGVVFLEAFPGQRLTTREEKQEKAAAAQAREDEPDANSPHGPDADSSPARALAEGRGDEGQEQHGHEAGDGQDDAQRGSDADRLEGAVRDAEADEVPVRAGLEQEVAVLGDGGEDLGVRGERDGVEDLAAHGRGDVQFLGGAREQEEGLDCFDFGAACDFEGVDWLVRVGFFGCACLFGEGEGAVVEW